VKRLKKVYNNSLESHLAELAHHFVQASPGGDLDKAIDYSIKASQRAIAQLAYEEAVRQYENVLQALELKSRVMSNASARFCSRWATLRRRRAIRQRPGKLSKGG
jgi:hypothetical protein